MVSLEGECGLIREMVSLEGYTIVIFYCLKIDIGPDKRVVFGRRFYCSKTLFIRNDYRFVLHHN
jgi:hypothetical protein